MLYSRIALADPLTFTFPGQLKFYILATWLKLFSSNFINFCFDPRRSPGVLKIDLISFFKSITPLITMFFGVLRMDIHHLLFKRISVFIVIRQNMDIYSCYLTYCSRQPAETPRMRVDLNYINF